MTNCQDDLTAVDTNLSSTAGGNGTTSSHYSLYPYIVLNQCTCLNVENEATLRRVLRPVDTKDVVKTNDVVEADVGDDEPSIWPGGCIESHFGDDELLVHVQFSQLVRVKSVLIGTGGGQISTAPGRVKVYVNHSGLDFEGASSSSADQEWELLQTSDGNQGSIEYPVRLNKFANVKSVDLLFLDTPSGDRSVLFYLGFMGETKTLQREPDNRTAVGTEYGADQSVGAKEERRSGWSSVR